MCCYYTQSRDFQAFQGTASDPMPSLSVLGVHVFRGVFKGQESLSEGLRCCDASATLQYLIAVSYQVCPTQMIHTGRQRLLW